MSKVAETAFGKKPEWWLGAKEEPQVLPGSLLIRMVGRIKRGFRVLIDSLRLVPLPASKKLSASLAENYQKLDDALQKGLNQRVTTEYQRLLDTFVFILDRNVHASKNEETPLNPINEWPTGIQAVKHSINRVIDELIHTADIKYQGRDVDPAPLGTKDYWQAAAAEDAFLVEGLLRRYERFRQSISSGLGMSLRLVVAWPLLYGLLDMLTQWDQGIVIGSSAIALLLLGLIELIVWRLQTHRLLMQIRQEINMCLSRRAVGVVAKTLYDYRLLVLAHLHPIRLAFGNIEAVIREEYRRVQSACEDASEEVIRGEDGAQYWLVDFKRALGMQLVMVRAHGDEVVENDKQAAEENVRAKEWKPLEGEFASIWREKGRADESLSWKSEARRKANTEATRENEFYRKAETAVIAKHLMPLFQRPSPPLEIIKAFRDLGAKWAAHEFKPQLMETYLLADEADALKDGVKWQWLFQRAHPMGASKDEASLAPFTLIAVPDDNSLGGPTGKLNANWQPDWLVIRSRQTNEIGCIRGVVEKSAR
jgi:hypothetical protein